MMKKIKAIFTGGTIGSKMGSDGKISPENETKYRLLSWYENKSPDDILFSVDEPYYILSENLSAGEILLLIETVEKAVLENEYDGIVVMHGTDTLQYTAAMLGYVFADSQIPIVLVSSDYPLEDGRANGYDNFYYGIRFIKQAKQGGVFVSYRNAGGKPVIHQATCLLAHTAYSATLDSVAGNIYGSFDEESGQFQPNPVFEMPVEKKLQLPQRKLTLSEISDAILRIVPYVGMKYPELNDRIRVILHESYHSGTISVKAELEHFAKEAEKYHIPIYLTGLSKSDAEYETVEQYRKLGVTPLGEVSAIAQYCKLWLGLSNGLSVEEII